MRSKCGVRMVGLPNAPKSPYPKSSQKITTKLGGAAESVTIRAMKRPDKRERVDIGCDYWGGEGQMNQSAASVDIGFMPSTGGACLTIFGSDLNWDIGSP